MSRFRVMVVDDDPDVRFVVTSLLGLEFETVEAQNGLDALEKIDRYEPDLLLLDINMPIMNGIACCNAIQRNPSFEQLPVFFITASSDKKTRELAWSSGGKGYIEKPFESSQLIDAIKDYFARENQTPVDKRFSTEEIQRIDATPLQAVDEEIDDEEIVEQQDPTATREIPMRRDGEKNRLRRVFGKQARSKPDVVEGGAEMPPAKPAPDDSVVHLPEPPKPDYGQVSAKYISKREFEELRRRRELQHKAQPAEQSREEKAEPAPAPSRPAPTPPDLRPMAPPPRPVSPKPEAAPREPSPAEVLAQRRLGALGKKIEKASLRPRVLVIIDHPHQLETTHRALKGVAEFLPLEDPVEAIELIARFQPDIVIFGIREERYSGLQLGHMMRTNNRLAHIEIIFVQGAHVEASHLGAAKTLSKNVILRPPLAETPIRHAVEEVARKPGFKVRGKNLSYGVYVKEVLKSAEKELREENKQREKESFAANVHSLARFMADEFHDYKEPAGMEELYGIGRKVHEIKGDPASSE